MVEGFVYVGDIAPEAVESAAAGKRVTTSSLNSPWIVVDHSLQRIIVARWPGRLFRVAVVPPRTDEEQAVMTRAASELLPDAGYTRALAVDVLEELPPSMLFGPHGEAVVKVISVGDSLNEDMAARLASARHPGAAAAYGTARARGLSANQDRLAAQIRDGCGTLAVHSANRFGPLVGNGFIVVHEAVWGSAKVRGNADAIMVDEEGELVLSEPWSTAAKALVEAAMVFGAPDLVDGADAAVLTAAWRSVIGNTRYRPAG